MPLRWVAVALSAVVLTVSAPTADRQESLRVLAREHGDLDIHVMSCGPLRGLREIAALTELTVEGIVADTASGLTAEESTVYTDYTLTVTRLLRAALRPDLRATPGARSAVTVCPAPARMLPGPRQRECVSAW